MAALRSRVRRSSSRSPVHTRRTTPASWSTYTHSSPSTPTRVPSSSTARTAAGEERIPPRRPLPASQASLPALRPRQPNHRSPRPRSPLSRPPLIQASLRLPPNPRSPLPQNLRIPRPRTHPSPRRRPQAASASVRSDTRSAAPLTMRRSRARLYPCARHGGATCTASVRIDLLSILHTRFNSST